MNVYYLKNSENWEERLMKRKNNIFGILLMILLLFLIAIWGFQIYNIWILGVYEVFLIFILIFIPVYFIKNIRIHNPGILIVLWMFDIFCFCYNTFILLFSIGFVTGNFHTL